ncbi:hypothetical protein Bca101_079517 [Brassica carinata]
MGLVIRFDAYLMIVMLMGLGNAIGLSNGYKFYVGGRNGWILTPSEDYSHCSHRNRFQVNDTLLRQGKRFSVGGEGRRVQHMQHDSPITSLSDGDSLFVLSRSEASRQGHAHRPRQPSPSPSPTLSPVHQALTSPAPTPLGVVLSNSEAFAPAPGPVRARNNAGSVGPGMGPLGLVLEVIISSMV